MRFDRTARHLELDDPNPMRMADHKESPLSNTIIPRYQGEYGYLTQTTRETYIKWVVETRRLPFGRGPMETITSLQASHDPQVPIQFWQLSFVFGPEPTVGIVVEFY